MKLFKARVIITYFCLCLYSSYRCIYYLSIFWVTRYMYILQIIRTEEIL
jgi:hypothetical protein